MSEVSIPQQPAALPVPAPLPVVSDPRALICCPCYGSLVHAPFTRSLFDALRACPCLVDVMFYGGDSLVNRARNNLVQMFMNGSPGQDEKGNKVIIKFEWLFFLDVDLIFQPHECQMLYDLATKRGPGIYAGPYAMKMFRPKIVYNALPNAVPDSEGVIAVREAGTGFMMVHRSVFEKMQAAYPENDYEIDGGNAGLAQGSVSHDWFQVGVKRDQNGKHPRFLSEDYFFCQKWTDMGGVTLMQTKICGNHIGTFTYPANPNEIIAVADIYRTAMGQKEAADKAKAAVAVAA
jgi:hypothetical protein